MSGYGLRPTTRHNLDGNGPNKLNQLTEIFGETPRKFSIDGSSPNSYAGTIHENRRRIVMKYDIRTLTIADYDDLIRLWQMANLPCRPTGRDSREAIAKEMLRRETCFLGMFDNDKLIAAVLGTSDGRKGWINRLAVAPEYRRQGLAEKLIKECENFLNKLGLKVLAALIEGDNQPSFAVFEKSGYKFAKHIAYYSKRSSPDD